MKNPLIFWGKLVKDPMEMYTWLKRKVVENYTLLKQYLNRKYQEKTKNIKFSEKDKPYWLWTIQT